LHLVICGGLLGGVEDSKDLAGNEPRMNIFCLIEQFVVLSIMNSILTSLGCKGIEGVACEGFKRVQSEVCCARVDLVLESSAEKLNINKEAKIIHGPLPYKA